MNLATLNPFSTAIEKATADAERLENGLAARVADLEALDAKIAALQGELSASIEAGRSTETLEASIAQCSMTAQGRNVAVRAAQDALARAKRRLDDLEHAEAVKEAAIGLEARQLAIARAEKEFSELVLRLSVVAASHARARQEEGAIVASLAKFGEKASCSSHDLGLVSEKALSATWSNGPDAVQVLVTLSVRASDSPAIDRLFP